jgi:hypothetical protein
MPSYAGTSAVIVDTMTLGYATVTVTWLPATYRNVETTTGFAL